ncbi:hypothetical protein D3C71_2101290 [compost metagenome]
MVDACAEEIAATQDLSEQTQLTTGTTALTLYARSGQCGFPANNSDEGVAQLIQLGSNGFKKFSSTGRG